MHLLMASLIVSSPVHKRHVACISIDQGRIQDFLILIFLILFLFLGGGGGSGWVGGLG